MGAGDNAGYGVATLVQKSDKSASHVYAHLSLLQPIPKVAEAFSAERITASHANLLARITHEAQATAYEQCWRKDWQDKEPHLLPANTSPRGYRLTSLSPLRTLRSTAKTQPSTPAPELASRAPAAADTTLPSFARCRATSALMRPAIK